MYYSLKEAQDLVIKAGLELVKKELIARTWGNISARISKDEFIITPSGKGYDQIKPSDLVVIKVEDASWAGDVKPSSEKGLHALAYKLRDDCNFIVHTHQKYATAISIEGKDFDFAPVAKYGLPGTKGLARNTAKVIELNPTKSSFLMERHGAICLGKDYEDAFNQALKLEEQAFNEYEKNHKDNLKNHMKPYLDDFAQMFGFNGKAVEEDELAQKLIKEKNALAANYNKKAGTMNFFDVLLQNIVYKLKYSKLKNK